MKFTYDHSSGYSPVRFCRTVSRIMQIQCWEYLFVNSRPSIELLQPMLSREVKGNDLFTVSVLKFWAAEWEDRLAELLNTLVTKPQQFTPNKKKHR